MRKITRAEVLTIALFAAAPTALALHRSTAERAAFQRHHPCPATGERRGRCPGYVIDHMNPLCNGGPDRASNMQWQTVEEARAKDRWERRICRRPKP